jgi:hypothetical protein
MVFGSGNLNSPVEYDDTIRFIHILSIQSDRKVNVRETNRRQHQKRKVTNDLLSNVIFIPFVYFAESIDPSCKSLFQFLHGESALSRSLDLLQSILQCDEQVTVTGCQIRGMSKMWQVVHDRTFRNNGKRMLPVRFAAAQELIKNLEPRELRDIVNINCLT